MKIAAIIIAFLGMIGAFLGIIPLAVFAPEYGKDLVEFQLLGAGLMAFYILILFIVGAIATFLDKPDE